MTENIAAWRANLAAQPGIFAEDVRELETHLLESIEQLKMRGLSEEEAFWLSCRRLGTGEKIAAEFTKSQPGRAWRDRAYWMAFGALAICAWNGLFGLITSPIAYSASRFELAGVCWLDIGSYLLASVVLGWVIWKWVLSPKASEPRGKSIRFVIAGLALLLAVWSVISYANGWLMIKTNVAETATVPLPFDGTLEIFESSLLTVTSSLLMLVVILALGRAIREKPEHFTQSR